MFQEAIESSFCYRIYLTEIAKEFESDAFFPTFDTNTYSLLRYSISHCCSFRGTCRNVLISLEINLSTNQEEIFCCAPVESDGSRYLPRLDSPCENRKLFEALINSLQRRCVLFPTLCCPLNQQVAWWPMAVTENLWQPEVTLTFIPSCFVRFMEAYVITIARWKEAERAGKSEIFRAIFDLEPGFQGISRFTPEEPWGNGVTSQSGPEVLYFLDSVQETCSSMRYCQFLEPRTDNTEFLSPNFF